MNSLVGMLPEEKLLDPLISNNISFGLTSVKGKTWFFWQPKSETNKKGSLELTKELILCIASVLFSVILLLSSGHSVPHSLFEIPKKRELSKNKTIDEKNDIINWQNENVIKNGQEGIIFS